MVNLFAHRGFWKTKELQNSTASLKAAHENEFYGVELDIWFCDGSLIVNHDEPQHCANFLNFSNYLKFGSDFKYWLDFKNLDLGNARKAFSAIKNKMEEAEIDLGEFYLAPLVTNYKIAQKLLKTAREVFGKNVQFSAFVEYEEEVNDLLRFITDEKISYLSISFELITPELLKKIPDVEIFAWTVNNLDKINELNDIGINNFITDSITPQIYESHGGSPWSQGAS
jgi:glycerophosphoryl diester phosphodiesterase